MAVPADINPRIVDSLYCDALALADELRARFTFPHDSGIDPFDDEARIALSCEGLRATTRTMHCLAWLLNHRAFFAGEISEFQLRRHGRLPAALPESDASALPMDAARLVRESERLYARIVRLERAWRAPEGGLPRLETVERLRQRLAAVR
jgi:regulator of CtrA degradation